MLRLSDNARRLVESAALGHVVTVNPDGSPHVSCVWIDWYEGGIVFASATLTRKIRNLQRDPRVAVSVESDRFTSAGLKEYLWVGGTALVASGGLQLLRRLARTYIGDSAVFQPDADPRDGYQVMITVDKVGGIGSWT